MPIYAYRCDACGHEHDALQKLSDPPLVECPACGAPALKKQLTAAAFRLKGAGWYETDFKKDGKRNLHEGSETPPDKATSEKSGDGSATDQQPAGKQPPGKQPPGKQPADKAAVDKSSATGDRSADKPAAKPAGPSTTAAAAKTAKPTPPTKAA